MPRIPLHDLELYYEVAGSGRPVVLVNSWGTTLRVWDQVIAHLSADHHVIAYDWRGCGRSDRTAWGNTINQNAADLLALIEHLDLDRPVVVGSSVGSLFALAAARTAAGRIGSVVVLDGPGHWATVMADTLRAYRRALANDRASAITASVANMYSEQASAALRAWTVRQILDASPHIDALFDEQTTCDPRPWLPEIGLPILYLHGSLDQAVPVAVAQEMASLTADSAVIIIDGAGHLAQQEQPAQVAEAVRAFSKGAPPVASSPG